MLNSLVPVVLARYLLSGLDRHQSRRIISTSRKEVRSIRRKLDWPDGIAAYSISYSNHSAFISFLACALDAVNLNMIKSNMTLPMPLEGRMTNESAISLFQPDFNCLVLTGGCDLGSVRAPCHRRDVVSVSPQNAHVKTTHGFTNHHLAFLCTR